MKHLLQYTAITLFWISTFIATAGCNKDTNDVPAGNNDTTNTDTPDTTNTDTPDTTIVHNTPFGAGFRYSHYGPAYNPGNEYWWKVGVKIAADFGEYATPECIWILGTLQSEGVYLNFPTETTADYINWSNTDKNEDIFCHFDTLGYKVWLQVEPGQANIDTLINLVLRKYSHHPCITGFGVDVEWHKSTNPNEGIAITNEEAIRWVRAVRSYNPDYRVFFKHWLIEKMPETERDGIVFINDSQMFEEMADMVNEFKEWGEAFAPAKVGFQYGYPYDNKWWKEFENPNVTIGTELLNKIPNTESLFWVDFTLLDVYPPNDIK